MKTVALILACMAASCSEAPPPKAVSEVVVAPQAPIAKYRTFAFGTSDAPHEGFDVSPRSLEVQRRLKPLVEAGLQGHGYVEDASKADFVVKLASGTMEQPSKPEERAVAVPPPHGYIGIDIYDASTGTEVWQGSAFAEIDLEKIDDSLLKMGVEHMLSSFPQRRD